MTVKTPPKPPVRPPASKKKLMPPAPAVPTPKTNRAVKTFQVKPWTGSNEGEKVLLYSDSGMGKTTLSAMTPNPVFIGLDDGGRKIKHPVTGEDLNRIPGIETFDDYRDALHQKNLFNDYETVVTDTTTELEYWGLKWMLVNVKTEKNKIARGIEGYGWGKGYRHMYETMHKILGDLDPLVRQGKNIINVCQMIPISIPNPSGEDYLCDAPKLQPKHGATPSIIGMFIEWSDHVFKIDHETLQAEDGKAVASNNRCIRVHPEVYFKAKSRTIPLEYPTVSFTSPQDDSIWKFLFGDR